MIDAFFLAWRDALAPPQRRAFVLSLILAGLSFALLWFGIGWALAGAKLSGIAALDGALALLGGLAVLFLSWLLFPVVVTFFLGFFVDGILARLEREHYPELPAARAIGWGEIIASTLRLFLLTLAGNLLLLPIYLLLPGINLFIYYAVNGYLLGRQYFDLVALRRLDGRERRAIWRRGRLSLVGGGIVIAFLLSLPVINIVAPLVAVAFMLHLFEGLRRRPAPAMLRA